MMKVRAGIPSNILAVLLLIVINGCGGEKLESQWKNEPITVDGLSDDWSEYAIHYFDKEDMQLVLGIANDDSTLNLMMKFRDQRLARMFESRGVTFWFNGDNRKDKDLGIFYHNSRSGMRATPPGANNMNPDGRDSFQPEGIFSLISQDTVELTEMAASGVETNRDVSEGVFCFELKVPLGKKENLPYTLVTSNTNKIQLGIELAAVSEEEQARMKEMMAERREQGRPGGMRGGGVRGGGGPRNGRPGGMPDMDGKEMWFTVTLAKL
jgi:hypothetical protein